MQFRDKLDRESGQELSGYVAVPQCVSRHECRVFADRKDTAREWPRMVALFPALARSLHEKNISHFSACRGYPEAVRKRRWDRNWRTGCTLLLSLCAGRDHQPISHEVTNLTPGQLR